MSTIIHKLRHAISHHHFDEIPSLIKKGYEQKKLSLAKLENIANSTSYAPLQKAVQSCKKMQELAISQKEGDLLRSAFFIETRLTTHLLNGHDYHKKSATGLAHTIHHDREHNHTYVYLNEKIGAGVFKTVTKSIQYNQTTPELVARAFFKGDSAQEAQNHRTLQGSAGLAVAKAILACPNNKTSMIFKLYHPGKCDESIIKNLSFNKKVKIAQDLVLGLKEMHDKNLIHRDLKMSNILVNKQQEHIKAVLSDFGQTRNIDQSRSLIPNATSMYNPPEALQKQPKVRDPKRAEVFSLGCIFYEIFEKKQLPWMNTHFLPHKITEPGQASFKKDLKKRFIKKIETARNKLERGLPSHNLTKKQQIKQLIRSMLHEKPQRRPDSAALTQALKNI